LHGVIAAALTLAFTSVDPIQALAQEVPRFTFDTGQSEKTLNLAGNSTRLKPQTEKVANLAGNSTRVPLSAYLDGLAIVGIGPKIEGSSGAGDLVLFAALVEGNEVVKAEASDAFEIKVRYTPSEGLLPIRRIFGERYPAIQLMPQRVVKSKTYPAIPWTVGSQAYGLVAPRRDALPSDDLGPLIRKEVERARKANDAPKADALVLFVSGSKECGEECAVETQMMTLLLGE
jgi:hypothetical protein